MQVTGIKIRGIEFGKGMPKLCVPIVGHTEKEILTQAQDIMRNQPDCVELRIDWFQDVSNVQKVLHMLADLRPVIGDTVLLFTFRSEQEGGRRSITCEDYKALCTAACTSGYIDLLDVEAFMQEGLLASICEIAHRNGVYVVGSNHDFEKTPDEEDIVSRLKYMDEQGADIPKIAVMPQKERDVLTLLSATLTYYETGGIKPIITMSMDDIGMVSRIAGEIFGSALTFATVGRASAPGQIPIDEARQSLRVLHRQ